MQKPALANAGAGFCFRFSAARDFSGGANFPQERINLYFERFAVFGKFAGGGKHLGRGASRSLGGFADVDDVAGNLLGPGGGLVDVPGDLLRRGTLLSNGAGNGRGSLLHFIDGQGNSLDRVGGGFGGLLNAADLQGDLVGGLGGLSGERFYLAGDDGKTLAGVTGPRGLDGGVQRQKVGLRGDVIDNT